MAPYSCSKAALEQLALQLKGELEVHDVNVHYFLPPAMDTKMMHEQKKMYPNVTRMLLSKMTLSTPEIAS